MTDQRIALPYDNNHRGATVTWFNVEISKKDQAEIVRRHLSRANGGEEQSVIDIAASDIATSFTPSLSIEKICTIIRHAGHKVRKYGTQKSDNKKDDESPSESWPWKTQEMA